MKRGVVLLKFRTLLAAKQHTDTLSCKTSLFRSKVGRKAFILRIAIHVSEGHGTELTVIYLFTCVFCSSTQENIDDKK